jgi:Flp pilus assembly pilin Flp
VSEVRIRKSAAERVPLVGSVMNHPGHQSLCWKRFLRDEGGQDLIEYSLILAFIALAGAAAFIGMGGTIKGIWTIANNRLSNANQSVS